MSYNENTNPDVQNLPVEGVDDDAARLQLHEEELQARKVQREAGAVRVNKDVVEEERTIDVPVAREQVQVRSVEPTSSTVDESQAFQGGTIEVPVREEDVQVSKDVRVAEELEIDKTAVQETRSVTDTVRREVADVDQAGNLDVTGTRGSESGKRKKKR